MKAVIYRDVGDIGVEEVPRPTLQDPQDAIIRVVKTAICGSDLHILHGELGVLPGTIIGHEFTGVVEEVGPGVTTVVPGDRVVAAAGIACGRCEACLKLLIVACPNLGVYGCGPIFGDLPGAQAEYIRVQFADFTLVKIPDELTDEQVIFVGDILSTAYMGTQGIVPGCAGIQRGDTVAIFGAGPVGLCAVAAAKLFGPASIIAIDMEDYRLDMALKMGADHVINFLRDDPNDVIREMTNYAGADFIIETSGSPDAFKKSVEVVAYGGRISIVGIHRESVELPLFELTPKNVSVAVGLANVVEMRPLIKLIEAGKLDLTPMITHRFPLDEAVKAYEIFDKRADGCIKVILEP